MTITLWLTVDKRLGPVSQFSRLQSFKRVNESPTGDPHGGWIGGRRLEAVAYPIGITGALRILAGEDQERVDEDDLQLPVHNAYCLERKLRNGTVLRVRLNRVERKSIHDGRYDSGAPDSHYFVEVWSIAAHLELGDLNVLQVELA